MYFNENFQDEIFDVFEKTGSFASLGVEKINLPVNRRDLYIFLFKSAVLLAPVVYWILTNELISNVYVVLGFILGYF